MTDDFGIFERNEEDGVRIFPGDGYFDNVAEDKCDKDGDYLEDYEGCEDKTSQRILHSTPLPSGRRRVYPPASIYTTSLGNPSRSV